jgi:exodeoxyribonuclease VII large subunit
MNRSAQLLQNKNHLYQKVVNNKLKRAGFDLEKFTLIFQHDLKRKLFSVFQKLEINSKKLTKLSKIQFQNTKYLLKIKQQIIQKRSSDALQTNSHELNQLEQILHLADPRQILKRGFSITRYNGKIIRQLKDLEDNALICTEIDGGKIESIIIKKNNNEQKTDL